MRVLVSSAILVLLLGTASASAADAAPPAVSGALQTPVAAPDYSWTGFYLGLNGGGGWGFSRFDLAAAVLRPESFSLSGGMFGGTVGYGYQLGRAVLGIEGDLDWANISGGSPCPGGAFVCQTKNTWLGTVRGRVGFTGDRAFGYVFDSVLPYLTGGVAVAGLSANVTNVGGARATKTGWTIGTGIEAVLWERWSAKAEYLYVDLGRFDCGAPCGATPVNVHFASHLVRAGLNYHF